MKKIKKCYIEITNVCNLACSFCPPTGRLPQFMTVEDFNRVLEKVKPFVDHIFLHVKGEPLLHPQLELLLDAAQTIDLKVHVTTNGTLIEQAGSKLLGHPAVAKVSFSLQSCEGGTLQDVRDYIQPILAFSKDMTSISTTKVELRLWNLAPGQEPISARDDGWDIRQNERMLRMIEASFQTEPLAEKLTGSRGFPLAPRIYLSQAEVFEWPNLQLPPRGTRGFCYGLRNQVAILVDGTVVPCCLDSEGIMALGNVFQAEDLGEILGEQRAMAIYQGFSNRRIAEPLCMTCGYRERFDL